MCRIINFDEYKGNKDKRGMEQMKERVKNKFAMKLAGDLEGMGFENGLEFLDDVFGDVSYYDCDADELDEAYGYRFRYECGIGTCQMRDMEDDDGNSIGIYMVYYKFEINPTRKEMIDFLLETGEFEEGFEEELDEDELCSKFYSELTLQAWKLEFDYLEGIFEDIRVFWDILIDDDGHHYRGHDGELYQY